jgi:glycosyltransferase involved in cell wall biosynthesis
MVFHSETSKVTTKSLIYNDYMFSDLNNSYSCIVPAYNEQKRILEVLHAVTSTSKINQVICVDDGSEDNTFKIAKKNFPNIEIVKHQTNRGKTVAVKTGISLAKYNNLILIDSDLIKLSSNELEKAIETYEQNQLDCLLICTKPTGLLDRLLRMFPRLSHCLTGSRILKGDILSEILDDNTINRYQLEVAQNKYLLDSHKNVVYTNISAVNCLKIRKDGFVKGSKNDIKMWSQVLKYGGLLFNIKQALLFARKKY